MLPIVMLDPIAVPLLVDDALALAPNVVHPLFIVAVGTFTLLLAPPLYNFIVAV